MSAVAELLPVMPTRTALRALAAAPATWYRRRALRVVRAPRLRPVPPLALAAAERERILQTLNSPRFVDLTPYTAYAELLDEGIYFGSVRTFYRVLATAGELRERRDQLIHPAHTMPQLSATAPNQVWSWDISKLRSTLKWHFFYLYVLLDLYSRYVVGWLVAEAENAALAGALIEESCHKHGIARDTLTLRPDFPQRFAGIEHARTHLREFFAWYNDQHRHSGIGFMTPASVHFGRSRAIDEHRRSVLQAAYAAHPERFKGRVPIPPALPEVVGINLPPSITQPTESSHDMTTTPALLTNFHNEVSQSH